MVLSLLVLVVILASWYAISVARGENQPFSIGQPLPSPAPTIADALTLKPEQVILPDAEFPLSGYRVDTDERFGPNGWTRVWRGSGPFSWVRVSLTVLGPSAGSRTYIAATKCDDWTFTPPALSAAEIAAPVVGDDAKACGYDFEDRPVGSLEYTTGTRNVLASVGVSRRSASQAAAAEFVASLADYQLWIIDRVAPPSGVALRATPKVQVPTAVAAATPRPPPTPSPTPRATATPDPNALVVRSPSPSPTLAVRATAPALATRTPTPPPTLIATSAPTRTPTPTPSPSTTAPVVGVGISCGSATTVGGHSYQTACSGKTEVLVDSDFASDVLPDFQSRAEYSSEAVQGAFARRYSRPPRIYITASSTRLVSLTTTLTNYTFSWSPTGVFLAGIVPPTLVAHWDGDFRGAAVQHELVHMMNRQLSSGRIPSWLDEGLAYSIDQTTINANATMTDSFRTRAKAAAGTITSLADLQNTSSVAIQWAAGYLLQQDIGMAGVARMLDLAGTAPAAVFDVAWQQVVGESLDAWARRLATRISAL